VSRLFAVKAITSASASARPKASKQGLAATLSHHHSVASCPFLVQVAPFGFAFFFLWSLGGRRKRDLGPRRLLTLHVLHIISLLKLGLEPVDEAHDLLVVILMEVVTSVLYL
jgi:hypothetical protein